MTRLVEAELLKLRTTRGTWAFLLVLLAIVAIGVAGTIGGTPDDLVDERMVDDVLSIAGTASLFALLAGVIAFTAEFRHGTITQTFLVEPVRGRVLAAKLVAHALLGLLFAALALALTLAIAAPWLGSRGLALDLGEREHVLLVAGVLAASTLWGAFGVSLGALVRNQLVAVAGVLVWLLIVEHLVPLIPGLDGIDPYLPGRASSAIVGNDFTGDGLSRSGGALTTVAYLAGATLLAAFLLRRRDVD